MSTLADGQEPISYPPSKETLERLLESGVEKPAIAQMCGVHRRSIDRLIIRYELRKWKPKPISESERNGRARSRTRTFIGTAVSGLVISPDILVEPRSDLDPDADPKDKPKPEGDPEPIPEPDPGEPLPVPPDLDPGIVAEQQFQARKARKAASDARYRERRKARKAEAVEKNDEAWQAAQAAIVKAAESDTSTVDYDGVPPETARTPARAPVAALPIYGRAVYDRLVYGPPTLTEYRRAFLRYLLNRTEPCERPTGIPEPAPDTKPEGWLVTEWEYSKMFNGARFADVPLGRDKPWRG